MNIPRLTLTIADDFLINPVFIRNQVNTYGFKDETFQGDHYHTVNADYKPAEIRDRLRQIYGDITVHIQAFRQGKFGSPIHNAVHADNTCATIAGVLYLNLPEHCEGGTAFWKHKETGWDKMPTEAQLSERGITIEDFGRDWHDLSKWQMVSLAGMKFNRLITYPSCMFHSRWPLEGFGDNETNARLIHAIFFDVNS